MDVKIRIPVEISYFWTSGTWKEFTLCVLFLKVNDCHLNFIFADIIYF